MYHKWAVWLHQYFPWSPFQRCMVCGKWYWGGLPWFGWMPSWSDYCSTQCAEEDMGLLDWLKGKV